MDSIFTRRRALAVAAGAALSLSRLTKSSYAADDGLDLGAPQPFDFDRLTADARSLAATPYVPPVRSRNARADRFRRTDGHRLSPRPYDHAGYGDAHPPLS